MSPQGARPSSCSELPGGSLFSFLFLWGRVPRLNSTHQKGCRFFPWPLGSCVFHVVFSPGAPLLPQNLLDIGRGLRGVRLDPKTRRRTFGSKWECRCVFEGTLFGLALN